MSSDLLKEQRDRFLAFSFAASDLLIEVSKQGRIVFALGAAKLFTGKSDKELIGEDWLELFVSKDSIVLKMLFKQAIDGKRCGPAFVSFQNNISKQMVLCGMKMPGNDNLYVTISKSSAQVGKMSSGGMQEQKQVLTKESFIDAAYDALRSARDMGKKVNMTMIDFADAEKARKNMGEEAWQELNESVQLLLGAQSLDGTMAAEIANGKYSIIHDYALSAQTLQDQMVSLSKEKDKTGKGLSIQVKEVSTDLSGLSDKDASRALFYTLSEFEKKGAAMNIESLNTSFKTFMISNAQRIQEFKEFIESLAFAVHFQPIVDLKTGKATHYESLCRFKEGNTYEWIKFGEDIGMASEFDIAVCKRAINFMNMFDKKHEITFSINVSGQSVENDEFFVNLKKILNMNKRMCSRIIFEITESSQINDLDKAADFVKQIKALGCRTALDDFGAGSASFQYLSALPVDYVKIDGKYVRDLLVDQRNMIMVKNLTQMCLDMKLKVVAEFVETQEHVEVLRDFGVHYGQGYFFGKPVPEPVYPYIEK